MDDGNEGYTGEEIIEDDLTELEKMGKQILAEEPMAWYVAECTRCGRRLNMFPINNLLMTGDFRENGDFLCPNGEHLTLHIHLEESILNIGANIYE